jgi:hypothetical protein
MICRYAVRSLVVAMYADNGPLSMTKPSNSNKHASMHAPHHCCTFAKVAGPGLNPMLHNKTPAPQWVANQALQVHVKELLWVRIFNPVHYRAFVAAPGSRADICGGTCAAPTNLYNVCNGTAGDTCVSGVCKCTVSTRMSAVLALDCATKPLK